MKKVITLDAVIVSLMGAMGYGFGYQVPSAYGLHSLLCLAVCMIFGTVVEMAADKIIFSSYVQKSSKRRYTAFVAAVLLFLLGAWYIFHRFSYLLWNDAGTEVAFAVILPLIAFAVSLGVQAIKRKKLLKKYGTGEDGFLFDEDKTVRWLAEESGSNKEVSECPEGKPVVKTFGGNYIGWKDKNGVSFLGIPYAKAPVGANRWKKPVPLEASDRTYEAYYFGNCEIQPESSHNILCRFKQDEDCLNLNIWTAKLEPDAKKPVLVYIHGGDGRYGGSANPMYQLGNLAKAIPDSVCVSINYRFGVFGVVDFSATGCADADEYKNSTALSLLDQIEALKWIKANIASFGGDAENITVAGDTSGGSCILLLSAMEEAKGLFKRAFVMCASTADTPVNDEIASALGKELAEEFSAESISVMKTAAAEKLRDFSTRNYDLLELPPRDGRFVPQDVENAYLNGVASDVEFIIGIAADDASGWQAMLAGDVSSDEVVERYFEMLKKYIGPDKVDTFLRKYIQSGMSVTDAKQSMLSDFHYKASLLHDCRTLTEGGSKVRCFYWDVKGDIEKLTASSVSMVTAILGNSEIAEQMGYLNDQSITEIMQAFVGKFIHGRPLGFFKNELKGFPEVAWKEYNADKECVLHIKKETICMTENAFSENVRELEKMMVEE